MKDKMTPLQRLLTTLSHKEPDRVPLFLLPNLHGAKELNLSIREYFSKAENVVEGQLRLVKKFGHDCVTPFFYGPLEIEAMGGEIIFVDNGPANSGTPFIRTPEEIRTLELPKIKESPRLREMLKATTMLKEKVKEEHPVIGVIIAPFSLPIMQMGFDKYLNLIYNDRALFELLMKKNIEFSVEWANAQLEAGALAVVYFDPASSTTIIPRKLFRETGLKVARETISRIKGPVAYHFASGRSFELIGDIIELGCVITGMSSWEDLGKYKDKCKGRITVLGNLDGISMRKWTPSQAEAKVKEAIAKGGAGGGFILADNHGEIPWQVDDEVLFAISEAVRKWGTYPLKWLED